jgi:dTDP-4-amino-4,6-dideoxygalactose transaminase
MIDWVPKKYINNNLVKKYIELSSKNNQFTNGGPIVTLLENFIKNKFKIDDNKSVIVVNNGTLAIHVLVTAIELFNKKDYNWATQSFTFPPSSQGPLKDVKILDIDDGGGLDINEISEDTNAIVVTNIFGNVVDINKYEEYCKKNNLILIFDNAATSFTFYNGKNCLNYGVGTTISFHHTKPFGFGEGGAIIVDTKYEKTIRCLCNFGIGYSDTEYFLKQGSNFKMSDISAAYILQYLDNFDEIVKKHKNLYSYVVRKLKNIEGITLYPNFSSETPFLSCFCLLFDNYDDNIRIKLLDNNIFCRKYYNPLKKTTKTMEIYNKILCIPCTKDMIENDIDKIFNII